MKPVLVLVLLLASALGAQPPIGPGPEPKPGPEQPRPGDEGLPPPIDPPAGVDPAEVEQLVNELLERRLRDIAPLRSRRQLYIEFYGGLAVNFRQGQKNGLEGIPDGGHRAPTGFGIPRAWLGVRAGYSDLVEAELGLRFNGDYSLQDEELLELSRAFVLYNRPLSQFVPFSDGTFADHVLFGLDGRFYRQPRTTESQSLGSRAFFEDEVIQARYTFRVARSLYGIAALSEGTLLGRGQVDDSNNYPLLADDRTRYWTGLDDSGEISRYLGSEFGIGAVFDWNATSFLANAAPFSPETALLQNTNYINILLWAAIDQLGRNELALIEGMQRVPFKGGTPDDPGGRIRRRKWRAGANLDFSLRIADGDLVIQSHYVHAEDGRFVRDAWGVDVRYTFVLPRVPFFLRVTPVFRYSELTTNNPDNPLDERDPFDGPFRVSSGTVPGYSLADAAGFAANRREYMFGVILTLARNVSLGFEAILNEEDFKQKRPIANDVPNALYILWLRAEF